CADNRPPKSFIDGSPTIDTFTLPLVTLLIRRSYTPSGALNNPHSPLFSNSFIILPRALIHDLWNDMFSYANRGYSTRPPKTPFLLSTSYITLLSGLSYILSTK